MTAACYHSFIRCLSASNSTLLKKKIFNRLVDTSRVLEEDKKSSAELSCNNYENYTRMKQISRKRAERGENLFHYVKCIIKMKFYTATAATEAPAWSMNHIAFQKKKRKRK